MILIMLPWQGHAKTMVVLGDSISAAFGLAQGEGWVSLLSSRLAEQSLDWQLVNASISGETTQGGVQRLPSLLEQHTPSILLIELGGNDALRGTPLGSISQNLEKLVTMGQESGAKVLLFGMQIPPNYGPLYANRFAALFDQVAEQKGVSLVGRFLEEVAVQPDKMQSDGIHPNAEAQPLLLDRVWPVLLPLLQE